MHARQKGEVIFAEFKQVLIRRRADLYLKMMLDSTLFFIVVVIYEVADLMLVAEKEIEAAVQRLH